MKKIFRLALMLLPLYSMSQNGGQYYENNVIKIYYLGYGANNHVFRICNKQSCEATIRTKADQDRAVDITVQSNSCDTVRVFRASPQVITFRSKAETSCVSNPDMGWLELTTTNHALELVDGNYISFVRGQNKLELKIVNGALYSSYGSLNYIKHVRVYSVFGSLKFDEVFFVKKHNFVDLNSYMKTGLNVVDVTIVTDNYGPERYVFKYIK